jgi:hypothetical protein
MLEPDVTDTDLASGAQTLRADDSPRGRRFGRAGFCWPPGPAVPWRLRTYSCGRKTPDPSQRWLTCVHNHAQAIVACDFFVVVTARFRILYVLVITELGRRQILHHNVTAHPSAEWTLQQFREALSEEHLYRF